MNEENYYAIAREYMDRTGSHFAGKSASEMINEPTLEEVEANARLIAAAPETAAERDRLREVNIEEDTVRQLIAVIREAQKFTSHAGMKTKLRIAELTLEWHLPEEIAKAEGSQQ